MSFHEVTSNEELRKIYKKKHGFIYNDYGTVKNSKLVEWNKLHSATCYCNCPDNPKKMEVIGHSTGEHLPKWYFDTFEEAIEWLEKNRKHLGYSPHEQCISKAKIQQR